MMLNAGFTTLPTLKSRVLPSAQAQRTDYDDDLQSIGMAVAQSFNQYTNRILQREVGACYEVDANRSSICIHSAPLEEVSHVNLTSDDYDEDITDEILTTFKNSGIVEFGYVLGDYTDKIKATYTGGYWLDDGQMMPEGATRMPADVIDAFFHQVQAVCEARGTFHTAGLRRSDQEDSGSSLSSLSMHPMVKQVMASYCRYT